jgi:ribosomal-protein-serine acetyltransferase
LKELRVPTVSEENVQILLMEAQGKEIHRMIYDQGNFAGAISIHSIFDLGPGQKSADLGYWISCDFEGRGIITWAIQEVTPLAKNFGIDLFKIRTLDSNLRSQKTALNAGFTEVRRFNGYVHFEKQLT